MDNKTYKNIFLFYISHELLTHARKKRAGKEPFIQYLSDTGDQNQFSAYS
jgi:hypothetical protein